jgi:hypothetical protein
VNLELIEHIRKKSSFIQLVLGLKLFNTIYFIDERIVVFDVVESFDRFLQSIYFLALAITVFLDQNFDEEVNYY